MVLEASVEKVPLDQWVQEDHFLVLGQKTQHLVLVG
jgi:hypothetical protein